MCFPALFGRQPGLVSASGMNSATILEWRSIVHTDTSCHFFDIVFHQISRWSGYVGLEQGGKFKVNFVDGRPTSGVYWDKTGSVFDVCVLGKSLLLYCFKKTYLEKVNYITSAINKHRLQVEPMKCGSIRMSHFNVADGTSTSDLVQRGPEALKFKHPVEVRGYFCVGISRMFTYRDSTPDGSCRCIGRSTCSGCS